MRDPVDEFAELTETIRALGQRHRDLRLALLKPGVRRRSNRYEVVVRSQTRRTLDLTSLPAEILANPRYFKTTQSPIVTIRPLGSPAARDDDIILIE
jgi:hypothetical protein